MADVVVTTERGLREGRDASDLGPDVTACDREPIHIPGAIQPHGLLLVADAETLEVVAGAGELEARLSPGWLGARLPDLLGAQAAARLAGAEPDVAVPLGCVETPGGPLEALGRLSDGRWLVQLEPQAQGWSDPSQVLAWLDQAGGVFERAADLRALCHDAARVFRQFTGFDRVMIYRFLDDDAGVVVAEDRDPSLHGFLNHHFPASDIPRQARALYVRNRTRAIPDIGYTPAPLRPASAGLAQLDMSDVDLRSVSPIHLQYLKNMGVAASASISIVKDGVLWGLVACHSATPRGLSYAQRMACQALAGGLARQVRAKEEAETYRERLRLRQAEDGVAARLVSEPDLCALFEHAGGELARMLDADGFAALCGERLHLSGRCPDRDDVREVLAWVRRAGSPQPIVTASLAERLPSAAAYADLASGLLAVVLSAEEPVVLLWFRAEERQVVEWAGNPHKAAVAEPGAPLSPRASFAAWSEEVRGRARPWSLGEAEAAQRLTRTLYEARQTRRIRDLNRDLAATVADKEKLLVQKEHLLREVNHRIQNSLQLVGAFLKMQARAENDPVLTGHLGEAQRRLSAVALVHRRLYSDDNVELVDLARYFEELVGEMKASMGPDWAREITLDLAPILIPADVAVNVGLVLTELVINANKYAYGGAPGPVSIALEQHRARFRLIVADRGAGKPSGGRKGFGTRMVAAMVDGLQGVLEELPNQPGLRVILTAPISKA